MRVLSSLVCLGLACLAAPVSAQPTPPVSVTGGQISGSDNGEVRTWFGVPFAAPPVGSLRWQPPQPVVPWQGVMETTAFSPACRQTVTWISNPQSEDCLYLNIWAPEKAEKLPVIVWIHGGGYFGGTGAQPLYDGTRLTKKGVIVVTINYRLGVFGFLATPELSTESPVHASGNQGIEDQIAALQWVKANIAAFGGDPDRVTIMGESAGANSVAVLVASPAAKGLFQRAIAESGNYSVPLDPGETARAERTMAETEGQAFLKAQGANSLADLRRMDADSLIRQTWAPRVIVDGHVLHEDMTTTYRHHRQNDVPILVGWNADEGKDLAPEILATGDFTAANHKVLVEKLLGHAPSDALLTAYPGKTDAQAPASINQLTTDWWGWRMWYWTSLQARNGLQKPYLYYFIHSPTEPATPCGYGCQAGHGAEIPFVFDQLDQDPRPWNAEDRQLADRLATYWSNFARTGDPNGAGLPTWKAFDGSNASVFRIGNEDEIKRRDAMPDFSLFKQ
ncbi:carboxylesterase/lipase family protein [Asticcacaulis taihuensis]|uniref:Carboxylic ester hydrolase n=1 Tax=Asticcacaulis taihuensis TaxID=260084 RepID=A0A1G4S056_9CAUL|nr:carboxylesterase family protein [Asticcacaulis taihuensis]SCW62337.1 para-nitrobenzyl esterase [Asticcacaulis taihuensis]